MASFILATVAIFIVTLLTAHLLGPDVDPVLQMIDA
jgi:hypothetical protein